MSLSAAAAALVAQGTGVAVNQIGGIYEKGKCYPLRVKLHVSDVFFDLRNEDGVDPSPRKLAKAAKVGRDYAIKIIKEIEAHGRVLSIEECKQESPPRPSGPGLFSLSPEDEMFLLNLRAYDATMPLVRYQSYLLWYHGKVVSRSTLSNWFLHRISHKASLRKTNLVPADKFKLENIVTYVEYVNFIKKVHPSRLHFGDEKSLKGAELFDRKARVNPITGQQDCPVLVDGDFRNTYTIMGLMSLNPTKQPFVYSIGTENGDSFSFFAFITEQIRRGWLQRGDLLVLDNAKIHHYGECIEDLAEFLWDLEGPHGLPMHILLVPFPTRAPELNPIELLWNVIRQELQKVDLRDPLRPHSHAVAIFAEMIMGQFDHELNMKVAKHFGY